MGWPAESLTMEWMTRSNSPDFMFSNLAPQSSFIQETQDVWAVFAELSIPLGELGSVQAAVRHEDYGGSVGATTDPKVGVELTPADWLTVRGSYGASFQAPTVRQTATTGSNQTLVDAAVPGPGPNNAVCDADLNGGSFALTTTQRGSDDLGPQTANSFNLGVVVRPTSNFRFSVDAYRYRYTNLIALQETAQAVVINDCLDDGIPNDPNVVRDSSGQLARVFTEFGNIGEVVTSGLDFAAKYRLDASEFGDVVFDALASYINKFEIDGDGDGIRELDAVGSRNFLNAFAPTPRFRGNLSASWFKDNHSANVTLRHIGSYTNDQSNGGPIDSFTTVDLQYRLDMPNLLAGGDTSLAVGATMCSIKTLRAFNGTMGTAILSRAPVIRLRSKIGRDMIPSAAWMLEAEFFMSG